MFDLQNWIERHYGNWSFMKVLFAIICFSVFVIGLEIYLDAVRPALALHASAGRPIAVKRWLHRDDPRGFLPGDVLGEDGRFDVAWISGSPISIRQAPPEWQLLGRNGYEMTDVIARYLVSLDGRPVRVQEYLLQGVRTGDMRRGVLHATSQPEIDAYLVEANTIWLLNEYLQFTLSRQRANLLRQEGLTAFDYRTAALLLRPHEIGMEFLGRFVPSVDRRFETFTRVSLGGGLAFPFTKSEPVLQDGAFMGYLRRWLKPEVPGQPIPAAAAQLRGHRDALLLSNLDPSGFPMQVFRENVRTLAATGKPVLLYLPPLNPLLHDDPLTVDMVNRIGDALQRIVDEVGEDNISFRPDLAWLNAPPAEFLDSMHLKHGQGMIEYEVRLLEELIGSEFEKRSIEDVYRGQ